MSSNFLLRTMLRILFIGFWLGVIGLLIFLPSFLYITADKKTINVLAWSTALRSDLLVQFQQETGIKVYVSHCETNEELLLKLESGKGANYDLIMPSDHIVPTLISKGLLQSIDHTQLNFFPFLNRSLLNCYFDPGNIYTVPFLWGIYGIGIDTRKISSSEAYNKGWSLFFDHNVYNGPLGMVDDIRELAGVAAYYLYGETAEITDPEKLDAIKNILIGQRSRIAMYTEDRADYILLSKTAPVVIAPHYDVLRAIKKDPAIAFVVPRQGSFILIDSCAIPKQCAKKDFVYQFLNYIFRRDIMQSYAEKFGFLPPRNDIELPRDEDSFFSPTPDTITGLHFFRPIISQSFLTSWWLALKT